MPGLLIFWATRFGNRWALPRSPGIIALGLGYKEGIGFGWSPLFFGLDAPALSGGRPGTDLGGMGPFHCAGTARDPMILGWG
jgi:hypothetical protein